MNELEPEPVVLSQSNQKLKNANMVKEQEYDFFVLTYTNYYIDIVGWCILIIWSAYQVRKILSIWCSCVIEQSQYGNPSHNLDSTQAYEVAHMMIEWPPTYEQLLFFATFPILYVLEAAAAFLHLFLSMFVKQLLVFLLNLPSPLLSFVLPMMKLSKSIHYMKYELMIKNLWGTWHH